MTSARPGLDGVAGNGPFPATSPSDAHVSTGRATVGAASNMRIPRDNASAGLQAAVEAFRMANLGLRPLKSR